MSDARPNTPPPDELAAIRAEMKRLESREQELRALLLANPDVRTGANWLAEVKVVTQDRTDLKELRACHPDIVEQFTFPAEVSRIVLSEIVADTGEILSPQRKAAARRRMVQDVVRDWLKDNPGRDHLSIPPDEFTRRLAQKREQAA